LSADRWAATGWTWGKRSTTPARRCSPTPRASRTVFTWPSCGMRPSTGCEKKITRAYKAKLSRAERKVFRSLLWEMRRDPACLTEQERAKLEQLFTQIPQLRTLYRLRVRFKEIFDTASEGQQAALALTELFLEATEAFPELDGFVRTYEQWQEPILNYFKARQTSGVVEGINNKARVVTKRAYGIKSAD